MIRTSSCTIPAVLILCKKMHRRIAQIEELNRIAPIRCMGVEVVAFVLAHRAQGASELVGRIQRRIQFPTLVSLRWEFMVSKNPSGPGRRNSWWCCNASTILVLLDVRLALGKELEAARYEASLAARRYELVDPAKRLVARELEGRWNIALERVDQLQRRIDELEVQALQRPRIDREALLALAYDLPAAWNAPGADVRTKQRLTRVLIQEVVIDNDDEANQIVLVIHWNGGRHTEVGVAKIGTRTIF